MVGTNPNRPLLFARPVMTKYSAPPYLLIALTYIGHNAMAQCGEKFNKFALLYVFSGQIHRYEVQKLFREIAGGNKMANATLSFI